MCTAKPHFAAPLQHAAPGPEPEPPRAATTLNRRKPKLGGKQKYNLKYAKLTMRLSSKQLFIKKNVYVIIKLSVDKKNVTVFGSAKI